MSKLVIKLNDEIVDHVTIEPGTMKIGRKAACTIVLDDLAVSGEHAHIFTVGDDSFVQDLSSTNGTYVNRARVGKHHLRHGDIIGIGRYTLLYLHSATVRPAESIAADQARTVIIGPESVEAALAAPAAAVPPAVLHILDSKTNRRPIELTKTVTNLGKTGKPAAVIVRGAEGYRLRPGLRPGDNTEKPKVNGRPVPATGVKLRNGDIIDVAGTRLQFYLK